MVLIDVKFVVNYCVFVETLELVINAWTNNWEWLKINFFLRKPLKINFELGFIMINYQFLKTLELKDF